MRRTISAACVLCLLCPALAPSNSFLQRRVADWLGDLNHRSASKRAAAAFALGRMGADAASAVSELAGKAAADPDPRVRDLAAAALGEIAMDMTAQGAEFRWKSAGDKLRSALSDDDPRVRRSAAYAIGAFGKAGESCAPALRDAMAKDKNASVRQNAAWALGRLKSPDADTVAALCAVLGDTHALVRRDAAAALGDLGSEAPNDKATRAAAKPLLDLATKEKDEVVRKTALGSLAALARPEHREYAPDLYHLLDGKDEETARAAGYALGNMGGEPARRALPVLRKALTSPDPVVQALAAATLANAGEDAADAVDDLAKTLTTSKNVVVRRNCCVAISHLKSHGKPAMAALAETLKPGSNTDRASEEVRELAAEAIAQTRFPHNEAAMSAVRTAIVNDKNQTVRQYCVWATFNVRGDLDKHELREPLTKVLDETGDASLLVRYDAARSLAAALSDKAPDKVVEVLLHMLGNDRLKVFNKTDANIKNVPKEGGGGDSNVAADLGGDARFMAAQALGWMKAKLKDDQKVKDALKKATTDKDVKLRDEAKKALDEIG